ncbi:MAG: high frequency lysogenization protein HflD [Oleibacter sp.]|nr:high frequency lysogenization protein HflD [Thalassolituus sp.]
MSNVETNYSKTEQQVIAMAALFQAATLVEELARTGDMPSSYSTPLIASLFQQNPESFSDIYGEAGVTLQTGLKQVLRICNRDVTKVNTDVTRYALGLLHLERHLNRHPDMLGTLGDGITQASRQADHFSISHENTISALADLYKRTLSKLNYRIRVTGNPTYLQQPKTANAVRTMLLAGIRAGILWRQVGGRRWHLLIKRRQFAEACERLLDSRGQR